MQPPEKKIIRHSISVLQEFCYNIAVFVKNSWRIIAKSYIMNELIEARASSVAGGIRGIHHGNVPVKGETAEVDRLFPGRICRDHAEHAWYCRCGYSRRSAIHSACFLSRGTPRLLILPNYLATIFGFFGIIQIMEGKQWQKLRKSYLWFSA